MKPTIERLAQLVYDELAPVATEDEQHDWSLMIYIGALGDVYFQEIDDYASDTDEGIGWSILLDPARIPDKGLTWLGQFIGVEMPPGLTAEAQRELIFEAGGWRRGTLESLRTSPKPWLVGSKSVLVRERYNPDTGLPDPYHIMVVTYDAETPSDAAVLKALLSQKPAGIVLHYESVPGQDYQQVKTDYATYQALKDAYENYEQVRSDIPGV